MDRVAEFARRSRGTPQAMELPLIWLGHRLAEHAITVEQLMQIEGQQQAADQVSLGDGVGSLRFLAAMDWRTVCRISQFGRTDLARLFTGRIQPMRHPRTRSATFSSRPSKKTGRLPQMNFATRDRYRHVVERIAKHSLGPVGGHRAGGPVGESGRRLEGCSRSFGSRRLFSNRQGIASARSGRPGASSTCRETSSLGQNRYPLLLYLGATHRSPSP